jgi:hypothetical protein
LPDLARHRLRRGIEIHFHAQAGKEGERDGGDLPRRHAGGFGGDVPGQQIQQRFLGSLDDGASLRLVSAKPRRQNTSMAASSSASRS